MRYLAIMLCTALCGCIGTKITGRDADTTQSHPNLHSVPDRPEKKDFEEIDEEREDFNESYEAKLKRNEDIRRSYTPPVKPVEQ